MPILGSVHGENKRISLLFLCLVRYARFRSRICTLMFPSQFLLRASGGPFLTVCWVIKSSYLIEYGHNSVWLPMCLRMFIFLYSW